MKSKMADESARGLRKRGASPLVLSTVFCNTVSSNITAEAPYGSPYVPSQCGIILTGWTNYNDSPANTLMNIVQGNFVTGFPNGIEFTYVTPMGLELTDAGIYDTVLMDNFFASDGSIGSTEIVNSTSESDSVLLTEVSDQWQGFWA